MADRSSRRRIAFNLSFVEHGPLTGPGYYAVETYKALHAIIKASRPDLDLCAFIRRGSRHHLEGAAGTSALGVNVPGGGRAGRVAWEQAALPFIARRRGIDLLFSPAFVSPLWGAPALAVCVPDMYYAVIPELIDQRQRQYWSMFVPLSVRRCGLVLAISEQTRRDVERLLPVARGKVRVTPLASRLRPREAFQIGQPWRPYLLMVANLTANKNVEVVVEGLSMIRAQGLDLELVHVGRDHHDRLGTAVRRFGMDGHVRRLGKVSDERLEVLYREAFAAVNASLYEGFGMPAVEAQAMGAPLISSNHPALLEAAGDEGALFYDPTKAADLAMHVSNLWADSDARERLRLKGYHNAQKLTWEATARGTLAAFDELLTKTPGRR